MATTCLPIPYPPSATKGESGPATAGQGRQRWGRARWVSGQGKAGVGAGKAGSRAGMAGGRTGQGGRWVREGRRRDGAWEGQLVLGQCSICRRPRGHLTQGTVGLEALTPEWGRGVREDSLDEVLGRGGSMALEPQGANTQEQRASCPWGTHNLGSCGQRGRTSGRRVATAPGRKVSRGELITTWLLGTKSPTQALPTVRSYCDRHGNPPARSPRFPLRSWMRPSCRTTFT